MSIKIISEIGINHNGDFRKIEELIRQSKIGGADYAKFQLYNSVRVFGDESRKQNEFTFKQVRQIKDICDNYGITFFFMDRLFGTYRNDYPNREHNIFSK